MSDQPPRKRARLSSTVAKTAEINVSPLTQSEEYIPKLFTLPAELQTMIYEYVLPESEPIHINVRPTCAKRDGPTFWRTTATIGDKKVNKPPLLHVCSHLRKFATPIYFDLNTFSSLSQGWANNATKRLVLRKMWGEHVKKMRSVEYSITVQMYDIFSRPKIVAKVVVSTQMKILKKTGDLVLSRRCAGSKGGHLVPEGEMCICALEAFAATLEMEGKGARPLWKIAEECSLDDCGTAYSSTMAPGGSYLKSCDRCGKLEFERLERS